MSAQNENNRAIEQDILSKIEELLHEAVRKDIEISLSALIEQHLARLLAAQEAETNTAPNDTEAPESAPSHPLAAQDEASPSDADEFEAIRQIITGFVTETLEEEAPAIIAATLTQALARTKASSPDPSMADK